MKILAFLILIMVSHIAKCQTLCDSTLFTSDKEIKFDKMNVVRYDTIVDNITYNCKASCPTNKAFVLGSLDGNKKRTGHWIIFDNNGEWFMQGDFKNNLEEGMWHYNGCCSTFYKNGRKMKTVCKTF